MHIFAVLVLTFAAANAGLVSTIPATTLVRAPSHDSAVIQSDRLGGNFAYSVNEAHAYAAISPVVQRVARPVAVSYSVPTFVAHASPVLGHSLSYGALPYGLNTLGLNTLPLAL